MQRRSFNWVVALVGIGLAGVVAVSAATALAARSAASPFELVVQGRVTRRPVILLIGTFTSSAPFCESGTAVYPPHSCEYRDALHVQRRQREPDVQRSCPRGTRGDWQIVEGSGRYASLRGKGQYSVENLGLEDGATWKFRAKLQGLVDWGPSRNSPRTGMRSR